MTSDMSMKALLQPIIDQTLYMVDGSGPYLGAPGLDFDRLGVQFRSEAYAKAEAKQRDWPDVADYQFIDWLQAKGYLNLADVTHVSISIDRETPGPNAYNPKHWAKCPSCPDGRGDDEIVSGTVRHSLNRVQRRYLCQRCGHEWDHRDVPWESNLPMLDDDGRYVPGGCVPYTISKVTGLDFHHVVLPACKTNGWTDGGMDASVAIDLVRQLGYNVTQGTSRIARGSMTLGRFLATASRDRSYIVEVAEHWLAVVGGENLDQSDTHLRKIVHEYWMVDPSGK